MGTGNHSLDRWQWLSSAAHFIRFSYANAPEYTRNAMSNQRLDEAFESIKVVIIGGKQQGKSYSAMSP